MGGKVTSTVAYATTQLPSDEHSNRLLLIFIKGSRYEPSYHDLTSCGEKMLSKLYPRAGELFCTCGSAWKP